MPKFLLVYRSNRYTSEDIAPEAMQQVMQAWNAWIGEGFAKGWMVDPGDALLPDGKVINEKKKVTDGPFAEAKEIVGGYSVVLADSYDGALEESQIVPAFERRVGDDRGPATGGTGAAEVADPARPLVEHFFRHESGRLVSSLARIFSLRNLDFVEDVVQASLLEALRSWRVNGVPENPGAWIRQVARNRVLDLLRHRKMADRHAEALHYLQPDAVQPDLDHVLLESEIEDSQLRMMFACCHPALAEEDQVALTLRTLCGFHFAEIARALLVTETAIKKRISRAKQALADVELEVPSPGDLESRLAAVQHVLYLLFNEGYLSTFGERAIRQDLCEEAVRLILILDEHPHCGTPATHALTALMLFHAARLDSRLDDAGRIVLLDEQDRDTWDADLIALGRRYLDRASRGERINAYHLEAGIALEHCIAPSFAYTDWQRILKLYDALIAANPSPVYVLNRAIALAHVDGPAAGIAALQDVDLANYHLLDATLGELHRRLGDTTAAARHFRSALGQTRSEAEQALLTRKLELCQSR